MTHRYLRAAVQSRRSEPLPARLSALAAAVTAAIAGFAAFAYVTSSLVLLVVLVVLAPLAALLVHRLFMRRVVEALRLAHVDPLTGLGNARHFLERLARELNRSETDGRQLSVCLIDVDDFKQINDRFGHPTGDAVLAAIAASLRRGGEGFRLGGDEFALLLPGCRVDDAAAITEAVLARISAGSYEHGQRVSASAGIASFPDEGIDRRGLVRAADCALYAAKVDGKDRVESYKPNFAAARPATGAPAASREDFARTAAVLVRAIRARGLDPDSRVGEIAARVATRMELPPQHVELIRLAGGLSDVGKLALPDEVLLKPGPLSDRERRAMQRHPEIGSAMLESLGGDPVGIWIRHHHERWDGRGYPERLAGERIPLAARILFVADAFDEMTREQAWRPRLSEAEALAELERCAGTQFDPEVVAAFAEEFEQPARPSAPPAEVA
jgi:diguanylate cyclase (GGDEF)-like protein